MCDHLRPSVDRVRLLGGPCHGKTGRITDDDQDIARRAEDSTGGAYRERPLLTQSGHQAMTVRPVANEANMRFENCSFVRAGGELRE